MRDAYLFDAIRTPRGKGRSSGSLYEVRPISLVTQLLEALRGRYDLPTERVDDVILGCVTAVGEQGANLAKTSTLAAGWSEEIGGVTLNRFCASGLEAVNLAAMKVRSGWESLIVAGGVESMSRVKMGSDGGAMMSDPATSMAMGFAPQGIGADLIATLEAFSRGEVDRFAVKSHQRAAEARKRGAFQRSLIPIKDQNGLLILDQDELIRPRSTVEMLAELKPAFAQMGAMGFDSVALAKYSQLESIHHVHTAGNSSGIVDGASLTLVGSLEAGEALGLTPRAKIISAAVVGTEPTIMLTGPAPATRKALKIAGLTISDIDLFEVNEAFASVVLKFIKELEVDPERVNVNGGAIAMGHPLGATGAMILGTLLDELEARDVSLGLATLCVGGGMGIATIIERV